MYRNNAAKIIFFCYSLHEKMYFRSPNFDNDYFVISY